jgi:hypothetical protein
MLLLKMNEVMQQEQKYKTREGIGEKRNDSSNTSSSDVEK